MIDNSDFEKVQFIKLPRSNCMLWQDERGHYSVRFCGESEFENTLYGLTNLTIQSSVHIGGIGLTWRTIGDIDKIFPSMQGEILRICADRSHSETTSIMILGNGLSSLPTDLFMRFGTKISITVLDVVNLVDLEADLGDTEFTEYTDRRANVRPYTQLKSLVNAVNTGQIGFIHGALTAEGIVSFSSESVVPQEYDVVINCFGPAESTFRAQLALTRGILFSNQVPYLARLPKGFEIEPMKGMEGRVIRRR